MARHPSAFASTPQMMPLVYTTRRSVNALADRPPVARGPGARVVTRARGGRKVAGGPALRIGVIVRTLHSLHHLLLVDATVTALSALGMDAIVRCSQGTARGELKTFEELKHETLDGIIFAAEVLSDDTLTEILHSHPETLLMNRLLDNLADRCVALDNRLAGQHAADLLFQQGHRDVAIVTGPQCLSNVRLRLQGFTDAMANHGYPVAVDNVLASDFQEAGGAAAMQTLLERAYAPTAVFCQNDFMAIGAMHTCQRFGLAVPDQISILGFDNIETCDYLSPGLTSIQQPLRGMGEHVAQAMFGLVSGGSDPSDHIEHTASQSRCDHSNRNATTLPTGIFVPRIVQRGSVAPVPSSPSLVPGPTATVAGDEIDDKSARQQAHITPRESDCLYWTAHGKTSWEIGKILGIAESAVTFHLKHAIKKLSSTNRAQAAARAVALGAFSS